MCLLFVSVSETLLEKVFLVENDRSGQNKKNMADNLSNDLDATAGGSPKQATYPFDIYSKQQPNFSLLIINVECFSRLKWCDANKSRTKLIDTDPCHSVFTNFGVKFTSDVYAFGSATSFSPRIGRPLTRSN